MLVLDRRGRVRKKVMSAVTDSGSEVVRGEGKEGIANLIEILAVDPRHRPGDDRARVRGLGLRRLQARRRRRGRRATWRRCASATTELRADEAELERILAAGAEKARAIAAPTLAEVRDGDGRRPGRPGLVAVLARAPGRS